jgi:Fic family protein
LLNLTEFRFHTILLANLLPAAETAAIESNCQRRKEIRIVPDEMIAGYSALHVRDFLRRYRLTNFYIEAAEETLVLKPRTAIIFMNKLNGLGFIEELDERDGRRVFRLTIKGQALANASAAKPIHRRLPSGF